jgi:phosphohistidine phosphatase
MARQLWLLRHGEAVPHDAAPDHDRELTDRGRAQSVSAGRALAELKIEVHLCFTSPKARASETARLACEPLGIEPQLEPKLAGGPFDAEALAAGLGEEVLLVGHDPDFSAAVHSLTGAQVRMKNGGLAAVDKGELILLLRPRELKRIADS